MSEETRPTWQHEDCPTWCIVEHQEDDYPEDRIHDGPGSDIMITVQDNDSATGGKAEELYFAYFRRVGDGDEWVHFGSTQSDRVSLTLSPESARALGRMLVAKAKDPALEQRSDL